MTKDLQPGDIVQIDPAHTNGKEDGGFGGCFMVVTEPKAWGAQGYVQIPCKKGQAFYRCPHEHMVKVGVAYWVSP